MNDYDDNTPPTWDEHADDLRGEQRALAMLAALLTPDEAQFEMALAEMEDVVQLALTTGDYGALEGYQAAQAQVALRFGRQLYGRFLPAVIGQMQRELADHIGTYDPDEPREP